MWPPPIRVRRAFVLEDSFAALRNAGPHLKLPLRVQYFNGQGLEEAGFGEGVVKEYLVDVIRAACAPEARLFQTTGEGELYSSPTARHDVSESSARFEFVGSMLGKALYENILLDVPLAPFFLAKLLGRTNTVNDLPSLDPELHRNLLFLKSYQGQLEDLALCYAVTDMVGGREHTTDLKPNGRNVPVTNADRTEYIHLVTNYRLNAQLRRPCADFLRGFTSVVPSAWVAMFSPQELGMVLSGSDAPIDVSDWRAHARYASGYHSQHPVIEAFWEVVLEMGAEQRAAMLRFATSSARPPLLGFQWLNPPFCVQMAVSEEGRLPTSATCMNLLKLPPYADVAMMREKLTYAINAGCGFELS
ncbi:HECT-domain-containing protein [Pavlovales sp. CCMP2436]|nr:HECT-domain-containing protein [Pavlovales sp. CCMP2436]